MECKGCDKDIEDRALVVHGLHGPMHFHGRECWNAYSATIPPKPQGYWDAVFPLEEEVEKDTVSLSGNEPELSSEEYMKLFNRAVNEGEELSYHLPAVKDLTPEELVDHVNLINKFAVRIRVAKQAVKKTLEERRITLSKDHREALRLRDMQYKPKPVAVEGQAPKKRRAAGTAKKSDAIENIMNLLGLTREQAEAKLERIAAKLNAQDESES
jgi:hypothetical protein